MTLKFALPLKLTKLSILVESADVIEEKSGLFKVGTGSRDLDKEVKTNLSWSERLQSYFLYLPRITGEGWKELRSFTWDSPSSVINVELVAWKRGFDVTTITETRMGAFVEQSTPVKITLMGEKP